MDGYVGVQGEGEGEVGYDERCDIGGVGRWDRIG